MTYANTAWAIEYKETCPEAYNLAMEIAEHPFLVVNIVPMDNMYMIEPRNILPDFPLAYCYTRKQAYELCVEMGWVIR